VPVGLDNVVQVICVYYCSIALKADGSVVAWEHNRQTLIDVPEGLQVLTPTPSSSYVLK
jgi:hypothetical protein